MEEASRGQASPYPYTGDGEEIYFEIVKIGLDYLDVDPNKRPKFCKTHYREILIIMRLNSPVFVMIFCRSEFVAAHSYCHRTNYCLT